MDPLDMATANTLVANLTSERMEVLRRQTGGQQDPRRSVAAECGFPEGSIGLDLYRNTYERNPIAKRVVEVLPHESWQTQPQVYEDEDPETSTPFEEAWDDLSRSLRGGSLYQDEEGSPIWEYLHRVDVLSGIGHFGLILLGVDDGKDLQEPIEGSVTTNVRYANYETYMSKEERDHLVVQFPKDEKLVNNIYQRDREVQQRHVVENAVQTSSGNDPFGPSPTSQMGTDAQYFGWYGKTEFPTEKPTGKARKLMFLRVFPEYLVQVVRYEANLRNPRFGQPVMYRITLNDPRDQHSGVGLPIASIYVHWSRVVHIADTYQGGATSSEVYGVPRMRPVMNNLLSLEKLYGASGEAYWKACVNALAFNTHPQLGGDVAVNMEDMRDQVENFQNSLQRFLTGVGGSWASLAPTVSDPTPHITMHLEAICICIGCPIRIFKGSERGELASSQDDGAWNDRLKFRQYMYISPKIVVPFVDRLILLGILPQPKTKTDDVVANWRQRGFVVNRAFGGYVVYEKRYRVPTVHQRWESLDKVATLSRNAEAVPNDNLPAKDKTQSSSINPNATEISKPKPVAFVGAGGYSIQWRDLESNTQLDKANIANLRTTALAAYVSGGIEQIMPLHEYLTHIMEFDDEEAQAIIYAAEKNMEESLGEFGDKAMEAEENDLVPTPPPGFEQKPEPPPLLPGMEGGPPKNPVKLGAGQSLVQPDTGKTIAKTPFPPKKEPGAVAKMNAKRPLRNANPEGCNQHTGPGCGFSSGMGKSVGSIVLAKGKVPIIYDNEVTSQEDAARFADWLTRIPMSELAKSSAERIEVYADSDAMRARMDEVGIDPEIGDNGEVRGAFDFGTKTLYASSWNGYEHSPDNLLHELGHSILGFEEESAENWASAHAVSPTTRNEFQQGGGHSRLLIDGVRNTMHQSGHLIRSDGSTVEFSGIDLIENTYPPALIPILMKNEWPIVFNQEEIAEMTENCGGEGGTMGPCPSGTLSQEGSWGHQMGGLESLKAISDHFVKSDMPRGDMEAKVHEVLSGLDKQQLKEAAEKFGSRSAKGKKERIEAIKRFISDRREMYQRTVKNQAPELWEEVEDGREPDQVPQDYEPGGEGVVPLEVR